MTLFNQIAFNEFIIDNSIVGFFAKPITLKSGRQSNWYVNWRAALADAFLADKLSDYVLNFVKDLTDAQQICMPDTFYGVPEGATKLGILCQYKWARQSSNFTKGSHSLAMGRAKAKEHGDPKDRFFVGMPKGKTVILEDTTTTGGSLLENIDFLQESDIEIIAAVGLTNRMEKRDDGQSVQSAVAAKKSSGHSIPYFQLSNALDLLPALIKRENPSQAIIEAIRKELAEVGVAPLLL